MTVCLRLHCLERQELTFKVNQQSAIGASANYPDETPQAERKFGARRVKASRKRRENERVAEEVLAQRGIRGEARLAGASQKKVFGAIRGIREWPGSANGPEQAKFG